MLALFYSMDTALTMNRRVSSAVALAALSHLALEMSHNFLPVIYPLLIAKMGLTYTQIGTMALVITLFGALTQPLFGYWSDRWDARWITVGSVVWIGLLMGVVGFVGQYWLLLVVLALGALGSAAFHPAGASLAAWAQQTRKGVSMSVFSVGGNIGSALSPLLVGTAVLWWGLRGTAVLIPVGLLLGGWLLYHLRRLAFVTPPSPTAKAQPTTTKATFTAWLPLLLIILLTASRSWFQGSLSTYLPEWLQSQGVSPELAGSIFSILLASVSIGSLTGGVLSDRVGHIPIVGVSLGLMPLAHWLFLNSRGGWQITAVALLGILIGSTFPVTILMAQAAWPERMGVASAMVIGLGWVPAGVGSWVVGRIADQSTLTNGLHSLLLVPLVGVAAVVALALVMRPAKNEA
jgi:FSR family fosmidomycin resistance protein-like MFS transporter